MLGSAFRCNGRGCGQSEIIEHSRSENGSARGASLLNSSLTHEKDEQEAPANAKLPCIRHVYCSLEHQVMYCMALVVLMLVAFEHAFAGALVLFEPAASTMIVRVPMLLLRNFRCLPPVQCADCIDHEIIQAVGVTRPQTALVDRVHCDSDHDRYLWHTLTWQRLAMESGNSRCVAHGNRLTATAVQNFV